MRNRLFLASVVAAAAFGAAEARAETRALTLMNTHTQERATVVFKRDGVYDQNGLQELNRLLRDWRRNEATKMDPQLFDLIWEVYRDSGATQPIHIVCGYRSPATNNMLRSRSRGVAKFSQHMLGKAMDFYLPGVDLERLREVGMKKQIGGVGFYPSSNFVHMDTGSVRAWPRMTREQLVRLFPDGKTAHLPADGGPLSGYQVALAESQARKGRTSPTGDSATHSGGGLLAALFGGGSSSSSSAAPGEDEEEVVRTPASRGQELRQGPVAPNKVLLTRNEDAPGVSTGPAAPNARSVRTQAVAPAPVAQPAPVQVAAVQPPVVTSPPAAGSLVALPQPAAAPRSAGSLVSNNNGQPAGWVVGPQGKQVAAAAPIPVAAPVPEAKPVAIDVAPPRAKPGFEPATRVAGLARPANPAAEAFAVLTGEQPQQSDALGYASELPVPTGKPVTADVAAGPKLPPVPLPQQKPASVLLASLTTPVAPTATATDVSRLGATLPAAAGKAARAARAAYRDPLAVLVASLGDDPDPKVIDAAAGARTARFASLSAPDQEGLPALLAKPAATLAVGFSKGPIDGLASGRFVGPAVVAVPVRRTE